MRVVRLRRGMGSRGVPWAIVLVFLLVSAAAEGREGTDPQSAPVALLMIEDPGCPYCARWDREVRQAYLNSEEGRFAPLVRRFRGARDVAFIANVIYSPTFVVVVRGQEIGRIVGYQGPYFFWAEIAGLLAKAGFKRPAGSG